MKEKYDLYATDEDTHKDIAEGEKTERHLELEDIRAVVKTEAGVNFLRRVLEFGGLYRTSFTGNSSTFLNEGRRQVALFIFDEIGEASPERLKKLVIINNKED